MPLIKPQSNEYIYPKLTSASVIGSTTTSSARLWFRVYMPGAWRLLVSDAPFEGDLHRFNETAPRKYFSSIGQKIVYSEKLNFDKSAGLTNVFDVTGLEPGKRYYYILCSDSKKIERRTEIGSDVPKHFMTMPVKPERIHFSFYSCHDPISAEGSFGAWPRMKEMMEDYQALFAIGGGDQAYVDTNRKNGFPDVWEWLKNNKDDLLDLYQEEDGSYREDDLCNYMLDLYRWFYRVYWRVPPLQEVFGQYPQYMIWDDHEIMDGWGSLTKNERLNKIGRFFKADNQQGDAMLVRLMWKAARKAYYEYQHSHNPYTDIDLDSPKRCQWDYSFKVGDASFYVLDMRGHHDIEKEEDPFIILGKLQMNRFLGWLKEESERSSQILYIVSPVPVVHWRERMVNTADVLSVKDDFMDEWDHQTNQYERSVFLKEVMRISHDKSKKIVFLSGDVHCASVFRINDDNYLKAKVFQVTSSAISRTPASKIAESMISTGGPIGGCDGASSENLYSMAGNKNFAMCGCSFGGHHGVEAYVDLCWPGENGEITKRRVVLD